MLAEAIVASSNWKEHVSIFLAGSTALGIVAHAVNTFPTPGNVYGQWLLGLVKYAVGQRTSAMAAMRGQDSVTVSVPQGSGPGLTKSAEQTHHNVDVTPETIKVTDEKVIKTETVVPNPVGTANAVPPQVPDK